MVLHGTLTGFLLLAMLCNVSQNMESMLIEVAALGRHLYPGMLYNCLSDNFISGFTLWDDKALREHVHVRQQHETNLKFSSSDAFSKKAGLLNMSTALKASFLAGLVEELGGPSSYLKDTKSSARSSQITLYYSETTRFEELVLAELGNITYPEVIQSTRATHMAKAVLYGAQAFMVFKITASDDEDKQEVERNLHTMVKKIPSFSIERNGSINMNENETTMAEKISTAFFGVYQLKEIPITFTDFVKLYKDLPSLLTEEDAVPVKVWLYPLRLLNDQAAKLQREISESLVSKVEHLMEELGEVERRYNDLIRIESKAKVFTDVKKRLRPFQRLLSDYKITFQGALQKLLPQIRGGLQEEQVLDNIMNIHYKSPFTADYLNRWLDNTVTELNMLRSYTRGLKDVTVLTSSHALTTIRFDPEIHVAVCLSFTSVKYEDKYLGILNDFLDSRGLEKTNHTSYPLQELKPWFTGDVIKHMDQTISLFMSFFKANKNEKGTRFIVTDIPDPSNPGASIQLYDQGKLTNPNFQPVSRPPAPILKSQDGAFTLILQKSPTGDTKRFRVEYREIKSGAQKESWETRDTSDTQTHFILNGLQPKKRYCFRYKAVNHVGFSEPSKCVFYIPTHDDIIIPILVGGDGGSEWTFKTCDFNQPLKEMNVSVSSKVNAVSLTRSNDDMEHFGHHMEESLKTFTFQDGDKFLSLTLWPNEAGDQLGGIEFEVVRENGQRQSFYARSSSLGSPVHVDVGSGVCCGLVGRSGQDIHALGFFFLK